MTRLATTRTPYRGRIAALVLCCAQVACTSTTEAPQSVHDLVIWRATSAGITAAVQAANMGKRVLILEPTRFVGGLSAAGLGATDVGNKGAIGGLSRAFYRQVRAHYDDDAAWDRQPRTAFKGRGHRSDDDAAWTFEPKVASAIFERWLRRVEIDVRRGVQLDLRRGVELEEGAGAAPRIRALVDVDGNRYFGRMFVDASYEGDLLPLAKLDFLYGREANTEFDETLNGVQTARAVAHQFVARVDPYLVPGTPESGLLPGISAEAPMADGSADAKIQAYCYRICATDLPENRVPWPKPDDYDEARYELLFRNFEAGDMRRPWHPVRMPNRKTDSNNNFAVSTDFIGQNWRYAIANWDERAQIEARHESWQKGLFWSLAHHERVPAAIRRYFSNWGLAKDEFVTTGNWPHALYVREGRRMRGDVVLSERHVRGLVPVDDGVGMGAYGMDSHHVQRYVDASGQVRNEGDVQVRGFEPYSISYRAIVPPRGTCANLVVPVAVSATHIAFGSIRMEPVFMVLGQSAATAACLSLDRACAVQDLPYPVLRRRLLADGQRLTWAEPEAPR